MRPSKLGSFCWFCCRVPTTRQLPNHKKPKITVLRQSPYFDSEKRRQVRPFCHVSKRTAVAPFRPERNTWYRISICDREVGERESTAITWSIGDDDILIVLICFVSTVLLLSERRFLHQQTIYRYGCCHSRPVGLTVVNNKKQHVGNTCRPKPHTSNERTNQPTNEHPSRNLRGEEPTDSRGHRQSIHRCQVCSQPL